MFHISLLRGLQSKRKIIFIGTCSLKYELMRSNQGNPKAQKLLLH
jgi:hypothetical protein